MSKEFFIGRQPILTDQSGRIYAYELLFRQAGTDIKALITDNSIATARVLINAIQNIGLETLLGGKKGLLMQMNALSLRVPSTYSQKINLS